MTKADGFKAINNTRISEAVLDQLKEAILSGRFRPGEKLPSERELIESFGVSRAVVREAIRALELTGFIVVRQGPTGGAFVTDLSLDNVSNAYLDLFLAGKLSADELARVRLHVEPEVARLAAQNITPAGRERLEKAFEDEHRRTGSQYEWIHQNLKVHYVLAEMCGNRFYEAIVHPLLDLSKEIVSVVKPAETVIHRHEDHGRIVACVSKGDAQGAAAAMLEHLERTSRALADLEKAYRRRKGLGG